MAKTTAKRAEQSPAPKDVEYLGRELHSGGVREHGYAALLGLKSSNTVQLLEQVETGLPYKALERLQHNIAVSTLQLAELLRIPPRPLARRKSEGRLQPAESDRLLRLSRIFVQALKLFEGDFHGARAWLFSPQPAFAGHTPIEFAKTELGAREVEHVIGRLEHGIPS